MEETLTEQQRVASAHFERLGRAMVETRIIEPRPKSFGEMIGRMCAIDRRCGWGTEDPLGGDWDGHLAYLHNRERAVAWNRARGRGV